MRRAEIVLDGNALAHNIKSCQSLYPSGCSIMAVVKANAYGHGAIAIAGRLSSLGITRFAVATVEEAIELRQSGIEDEILILGYCHPDDFHLLAAHNITQAAVSPEHAAQLEAFCRLTGRRIKVHISVDTGMHRIGFGADAADAIEAFYRSNDMEITGIYSHMCAADSADEDDMRFSRSQGEAFKGLIDALRFRGVHVGTAHLLGSYASVNYPEYAFDSVRLGVLMYGIRLDRRCYLRVPVDIRPVMTLKTIVTNVREIPAGDTVGYGRTFRAERPTKVAVLPLGYADGIPRSLSGGRLRTVIHGTFAPGIGRICMDQMMVDVTDVEHVQVGDEAVLIGSQGGESIACEELAENAGTITLDIVSGLGDRIEGRSL